MNPESDDTTLADLQPAPDSSPEASVEEPAPADATPKASPGSDGEPAPRGQGPVPLKRHEAILRRTRDTYEQKLREVAWAAGVNPDDAREALDLHKLYRSDPRRLYDHLHGHFSRQSLPEPDLRAEDGTPLYSQGRAVAMAQHVARQAVQEAIAGLEQRLGPIEQWSTQNRVFAEADAQIEAMQALPGFSEAIEEITDAIASARQQGGRLSLPEAYIQVVVPRLAQSKATLTAEAKKAILAELNGTADRARGATNPARSAPASHRRDADRDWGELLREEAARRT